MKPAFLINAGLRRQFDEAAARRSQSADAAALGDRQLAAIGATWTDAIADIPYYASLVSDQLAPRSIESWNDVRALPILTRRILQERGAEFLRDSGAPQSFMKTAGSTGEPLRIGMNQRERDLMRVVKLAEWQSFGYTQSSRLFLIWGHGHLLGTGWRGQINHARRKLTDAFLGYQRVDAYRLDQRSCEQHAEALIRFRPIGLISYASALDLFARYTTRYRDRFRALNLRFVLSTAEAPPRPDTIERLEDLFGCPAVQEYGGAEFGQVAFKRGGAPFSVYHDLNYVEAIAAEAGDPGFEPLLVTTLYPRYLPLIRYQVGDAIGGARRFSNGHVHEFDTMAGRINDVIELAPGQFIHSVAVFHCVHQEPAVHGIQMVLTDAGIEIHLVAEDGARAAMEQRIRGRLAQVHPALATAAFSYGNDLQPTRAGKRRWYVESADGIFMCGIAGILSHGGAPDLASRAALMERALSHRGPDGHAVWASRHCHAAFAHTRLAIIDPTPAARQPMSIDDGRLTITFNGEIYNFMEIRRELEARGVRFQSRADSEVVLRAYDAFGEQCVERLRGMFAFAIWDERERHLLLARDRFGIKPLYYSIDRDRLAFASELRALVASGLVPATVDASAAYAYFRAGSVPEPRTLLAGAKCLEAGHVAVWRGGQLRQRRYFDLSFAAVPGAGDAAARTRAALVDSVQHHFVADVPVGIFLSGGIDSTALLALASAVNGAETRALTMAMPGSHDNELALAKRTAAHFGVRHDVCEVDAHSAKALFAEYLAAMDQPSIDGMNTLAVSNLAKACGMKVMLSGIGADELFGGYPSVHAVPSFTAWNRRLAAGGPLRTVVGRMLERLPDPRWRRLGDMLGQAPELSASYATYRGIFTRREARQLTRQFVGDPRDDDASTSGAPSDPTPQDAACRLEMTRYLRNQLLRDADVMSMARGVEVRVPYIDARVVETVTAIPQHERLGPAKSLLRRAVPEIPEWIASQPKRGFMFPMERWLNGAWRGTFDETDARAAVPTRTWYRKWCVHAFEVWLDRATRGMNG